MARKTTTFPANQGVSAMASTQTVNDKSKSKDANGTKADSTASVASQPALDAEKAETAAETEAKGRGVIPTMPMAIIYREGGKVHAAIHHPLDGSSYVETGKGEGSAKGALEDSGFRLSSVTLSGPEWLRKHLPSGAELIGFASIKSFPLPVQSK